MKNIFIIITVCCLIACSSTPQTEQLDSNGGVQILGLLFGIKFNESGQPIEIRYSKAVDTNKNTINFTPNEKLMTEAFNKLNKREYNLPPDFDYSKESFVICIYTNVSPDEVMCGKESET